MSITLWNQFTNQLRRLTKYPLKDGAENNRQPCQYCMDLKRENLVEGDYNPKSFTFNPPTKRIKCPYCKLIINAMQALDINQHIGRPWELRAGRTGLVLKGNENGTKHTIELYKTPGTCRCKYTWRPSFSTGLTTLPDRRKEVADPSKLHRLFQTCPLHVG
jgi:hypothetical protein